MNLLLLILYNDHHTLARLYHTVISHFCYVVPLPKFQQKAPEDTAEVPCPLPERSELFWWQKDTITISGRISVVVFMLFNKPNELSVGFISRAYIVTIVREVVSRANYLRNRKKAIS